MLNCMLRLCLIFKETSNLSDYARRHTKSLQLCLALCDPMGCSLTGSSVYGILQARILEWVAMPSTRGSSQPTCNFTSNDEISYCSISSPAIDMVFVCLFHFSYSNRCNIQGGLACCSPWGLPRVAQLCLTLCDPHGLLLPRPWDFPGKSIGMGCHFLLQRIFLTQGSNPGFPHCRDPG